MDGLECEQQSFELYPVLYWKPVELLQDRCNVTDGWCSGDDLGSSILNQLKFIDGFVGETSEKGIAIIQTGGDQGVDQYSSAAAFEGGTKEIDVAKYADRVMLLMWDWNDRVLSRMTPRLLT